MANKNAKNKIRVTFPTGEVFCDNNSIQTWIQVCEKVGWEKIESLNLKIKGWPIVSHSKQDTTSFEQCEVGNGYWCLIHYQTSGKFVMLGQINDQLGLGLKIEMGEDLEPLTNSSYARTGTRKEKTYLCITFPDGTKCYDHKSSSSAFIDAMKHIGINKLVPASDLNVSGMNLLTHSLTDTKKQVEFAPGLYLTIPVTPKDFLRLSRTVSLMTHVPLKAELV